MINNCCRCFTSSDEGNLCVRGKQVILFCTAVKFSAALITIYTEAGCCQLCEVHDACMLATGYWRHHFFHAQHDSILRARLLGDGIVAGAGGEEEQDGEKHAAYIGTTQRVLIDGETGRDVYNLSARTNGGRLVHLQGDPSLIGQFRTVTVTDGNTWALYGPLQ